MLICDNISKSFGQKKALDGFSANTKKAKAVALLGSNGSGKSTLANILIGLKKVDFGNFQIAVENINKAMQFQNAPIFQTLNLYDNFVIFCALYQVDSSKSKIDELLHEYSLFDQRKTLAKNLSAGQKQSLSIALCLIASPNFIIFDEPMNNLDPIARINMRERILKLKKQGVNILFISHDLAEISNIADYYLFIKSGSLLASGSLKEIYKKTDSVSIEAAYAKLYSRSE